MLAQIFGGRLVALLLALTLLLAQCFTAWPLGSLLPSMLPSFDAFACLDTIRFDARLL